jgi:PilZ domain
MHENSRPPNGPSAFDVVEIVDRLSASRVSASVESANDCNFVLRLSQEARIPEEAHLRWFDGASAWQAIAQMRRIDEARVSCEIAPSHEWEAAPARRSVRAPVENSPLLVRIVESKVLARGRRVHAVCVDISDTGCRAKWAGGTPRAGDAVDVAWESESSRGGFPEWLPARVTRIIPRPFGAHHVCFSFEIRDPAHAALVREWHRTWLQNNRQRARDEHAA